MGFWFFMLLVDLLIPLMMLIFGSKFRKGAPDEINYVYGYRTNRSMQNEETWAFAHKVIGKVWTVLGVITTVLTVVVFLLLLVVEKDTVSNFGIVICYAQIFELVISIFFTESALKKEFDENGERRNKEKK